MKNVSNEHLSCVRQDKRGTVTDYLHINPVNTVNTSLIYLDNNATTRVSPGVLKEMSPLLQEEYGNPSSSHSPGKKAKELLETARGRAASFLNCKADNIIFTSGGTESNNLAIIGFARRLAGKRHFITSNVEHPAVLEVFGFLERSGHRVTYLPVDRGGLIFPRQLEEAITPETALISLMMANNETGVIFPVHELAQTAGKHGIPFHCDAVQGAGKIPINMGELEVDFLTISGHKMHGPKGVGVLFVRDRDMIAPLILGGGQEGGKRSGTEALPAIVGLGKACEIAARTMPDTVLQIAALRDRLEQGILDLIPGSHINGNQESRLCNTSNIRIRGTRSSDVLQELSKAGVFVSHGSACSSCHGGSSHVLKAMGLSDSEINASLRFSLSRENTADEIRQVLGVLPAIVERPGQPANIEKECPVCSVAAAGAHKDKEEMNANLSIIPGLKRLRAETAGDPGICIAVLDGPVDLTHACFQGAELSQLGFPGSGSTGFGTASTHGTHVASIIFGQPGSPVTGVAPGCKGLIVPIFKEGDNGKVVPCSQVDLAQAITEAVEHGANVINISGGMLSQSSETEPLLEKALGFCNEKGVLVIAAAGNDGCQCLHIPAAISSVITVGAVNRRGLPMDFSNWGDAYQTHGILAPGENIPGAVPAGGTAARSGTSYAAAIVSGVIGLLLSVQITRGKKPDPHSVRAALFNSASPCNPREYNHCERFLLGRLDVPEAYFSISGREKMGEGKINAASFFVLDGFKSKFQINNNKEKIKMVNHEKDLEIKEPELADESQERKEEPTSHGEIQQANQMSSNEEISSPFPMVEAPVPGRVMDSTHELMHPSGCSFNGNDLPPLVYALGKLGYDFVSKTRKDAFAQQMGNPNDHARMLAYLEKNPYDAEEIVWTLNIDGTPVYAIRPGGGYANIAYQMMREFLKEQLDEGVERVSIPGVIAGKVKITNGQELQVIFPVINGMYSWHTGALVKTVLGAAPTEKKEKEQYEAKKTRTFNFLDRVYYELRNTGTLPQERAINFVATKAFQVERVFEAALGEGMELSTIGVEKSPILSPGSDCWDVKLIFFDPKKRMETARKVYRITVDVSDVVPVAVGKLRSWSFY